MCLHTITVYHKPCMHLLETLRGGIGYIPPQYCETVKNALDFYHTQPLRAPEPEPFPMPHPCPMRWSQGPGDLGNVVTMMSDDICPTCRTVGYWATLHTKSEAVIEATGLREGVWMKKKRRIPRARRIGYTGPACTDGENQHVGSVYAQGYVQQHFTAQPFDTSCEPPEEAVDESEMLRRKFGQLRVPRTCGTGGPVIVEDCMCDAEELGYVARVHSTPTRTPALSTVSTVETVRSPSVPEIMRGQSAPPFIQGLEVKEG